jgi:putative addiction module CopG family antidote
MRSTQQMSVTLPHEMAQLVRDKVACGEYASESEVIRDGLRSLIARDRAMEEWLRTEAAAVYDALRANPGSAVPLSQVRANLAKEYRKASKKSKARLHA